MCEVDAHRGTGLAMDDHELDRLLATQVQQPRADTAAAVGDLVRAARVDVVAASPRRLQRRRLFVGGVVLGAVVLTGGGTLTAAQLGMPPFQGLEPGVQRIQAPIAVDYISVTGKNVQCEAFLEFRHLSQDQLDDARTYVAARDWSRTGQQAYDTAKNVATSSEPDAVDQAFNEVLDERMEKLAVHAVPGAVRNVDAAGPQITGWSMSCPTGQR